MTKPVKLSNRKHGLYSWSNERDPLSNEWLSANVFREQGKWCVRFFAARQHASVWDEQGVWTLRMVRYLLGYVAEHYEPGDRADWPSLRYHVKGLAREAWLAAADEEIDRHSPAKTDG
ncbi:hypothetical protein [Amycolatopsis anabasis]|uniref:hypothetical protein n=1 Tax=Amycolatopsis anabasis TaxID=1840409 RepID=UPI00131BA495|nr:hypothetical protein [Amycolatopsis anabasis]